MLVDIPTPEAQKTMARILREGLPPSQNHDQNYLPKINISNTIYKKSVMPKSSEFKYDMG